MTTDYRQITNILTELGVDWEIDTASESPNLLLMVVSSKQRNGFGGAKNGRLVFKFDWNEKLTNLFW